MPKTVSCIRSGRCRQTMTCRTLPRRPGFIMKSREDSANSTTRSNAKTIRRRWRIYILFRWKHSEEKWRPIRWQAAQRPAASIRRPASPEARQRLSRSPPTSPKRLRAPPCGAWTRASWRPQTHRAARSGTTVASTTSLPHPTRSCSLRTAPTGTPCSRTLRLRTLLRHRWAVRQTVTTVLLPASARAVEAATMAPIPVIPAERAVTTAPVPSPTTRRSSRASCPVMKSA